MRKNVASQVIGAQLVSATDGSAFTGVASVAVTVDGGTQGAGTGTGPTHEGNGFHSYVPAQSETNGPHVAFTFTGSGAVPVTVQVYPVSYDPGDTVRLGLTALPNAAADAAGGLPISDAGGLDLDAKIGALTFTVAGDVDVNVQSWKGAAAAEMTGDSFARLGAPAGASVSADIAAVKTDTGNLVARITATLFGGITSLAQWLGLLAGKQVGNATARTELRATGAGSGTFDETADSLEAIRDTAPLGTAMRGTDNAALASVCTETRLAELDGANLPTDVAGVKSDTAAILADTSTDGVVVAAGSKTGYSLAADQSAVTVGTVNTLAGHTAQTGDAFARLGAPAGASVSADVAAVKTDTAATRTDAAKARKLLGNKMEITDATGVVALYDDDNTTPIDVGTPTVTDDSTTTTRTKVL